MTTGSLKSSKPILRIGTEHHVLELMKSALLRVAGRDTKIEIRLDDVVLSGRVQRWYQKQAAQECIRNLALHRTIQNRIEVSGL